MRPALAKDFRALAISSPLSLSRIHRYSPGNPGIRQHHGPEPHGHTCWRSLGASVRVTPRLSAIKKLPPLAARGSPSGSLRT